MSELTTEGKKALDKIKQLAGENNIDLSGAKVRRTSSRFCLGVEHGDYNGTELLGVGTDRFIWMAYKPNGTDKVRLASANFPDDGVIDFQLGKEVPDKTTQTETWGRYPLGLEATRRTNFTDNLPPAVKKMRTGLDGVLYGNIPEGGMSRSASLCGNISMSLCDVNNIALQDQAAMFGLVDWCQAAENKYVDSPCGQLDQIMIYFSREGMATHYNPGDKTIRYISLGDGATDFRIVVLDSGTSRMDLGKATYNLRRKECEDFVKILRGGKYKLKAGKKQNQLISCLADVTESVDYLAIMDLEIDDNKISGEVRQLAAERGKTTSIEDYKRRLTYIFGAQKRFYDEILPGWEDGDIEKVGAAFRKDGIGLRDDYCISGPHLETMCDIARGVPGVIGERMLGGGDKGASGALVRAEAVDGVRKAVDNGYPRSRPAFADKYAVHVCRVVEGVKVFEGLLGGK